MKESNTRERFLRTLRFQSVDRPPNFELGFWGHTLERFVSEGMPREAADYSSDGKGSCTDAFYGHPFFGIEHQECLPIDFGPMPSYEYKVIEENERYIVYRDTQGITARSLKTNTVRGTRWSMDQYLDFPVKNREDFEEMKQRYDPHDPKRYPSNWSDLVERYRERDCPLALNHIGTLGFYGLGRFWMGTHGLSKAFFQNPRLVHDMFDFIADFIIGVSRRALADTQLDCVQFFEDFAGNSGPLFSPRIFKEFMLPRYKRVTDFLRKHGVDIIFLDSDGNVEVLLPLLIEAGITVLWPLEVAAGMNPLKIRREYGHDLALMGGIDKREIAKDKKAVKHEVMGKLPQLVADGGYIPMIDHIVPPDVSYRNFLFYLKAKLQAMQQQ